MGATFLGFLSWNTLSLVGAHLNISKEGTYVEDLTFGAHCVWWILWERYVRIQYPNKGFFKKKKNCIAAQVTFLPCKFCMEVIPKVPPLKENTFELLWWKRLLDCLFIPNWSCCRRQPVRVKGGTRLYEQNSSSKQQTLRFQCFWVNCRKLASWN